MTMLSVLNPLATRLNNMRRVPYWRIQRMAEQAALTMPMMVQAVNNAAQDNHTTYQDAFQLVERHLHTYYTEREAGIYTEQEAQQDGMTTQQLFGLPFVAWDFPLPRAQRMSNLFDRVERVRFRVWYRNTSRQAENVRLAYTDAALDRIAN